METPLVSKQYKLEKFPGKGGWTYTMIPEIAPAQHRSFGWVKVKGRIDGVEIKNYHLMPYNGKLFLPVKAAIRKKIGKQEGDWVQVELFLDEAPAGDAGELLLCLAEEPLARDRYLALSAAEQSACLQWIYAAKNEAARVDRLAETINRLLAGQAVPGKEAAGR